MVRRLPLALGLVALALMPASAGTSAPTANVASAQGFAIKIIVPGQSDAISAPVAASPGDAVAFGAGFSYPEDGSVLTSGAITASASADPAQTSTASASAEVTGLSLFGGEITVARVAAKVRAAAGSLGSSGDFGGTTVSGVGGSAVAGNTLGSWGTLTLGKGEGAANDTAKRRAWHGSALALDIKLIADHGGLPAGSEIQIGYVEADVAAATVELPQTVPAPAPGKPGGKGPKANAPKKPPEPNGATPLPIHKIPTVQPKLTAGGYVFPVYGPASYTDTFGAPRADVAWHHGGDIFAPLGAPVLAVAKGTVFSVGWNRIGGWRLWLVDRQGNQFYYAHLSAYSPAAVNGARVHAGTVLGFVGSSGDAEGTPYHLHFEIHPVGLLPYGYDGAVDPTPYLDAWRRVEDLRFSNAGAWVPGRGRSGPLAPQAGAILLQVSDISTASGLDPGSLQRALAPIAREGDSALVGGLAPPTSTTVAGDLGRG